MNFKVRSKDIGLLSLIALFAIVLILHVDKKKQLENAEFALGKIYDQEAKARGGSHYWLFSFKVDGKVYRGSDLKSKKSGLSIGQFCLIRYEKGNTENSEIVYGKSPINVLKELGNYDEISANLIHMGEPFNDLIFIRYTYKYKEQSYTDKSRIYTYELDQLKLNDSIIKLKVSKRFPELNDVAFANLTKKDWK